MKSYRISCASFGKCGSWCILHHIWQICSFFALKNTQNTNGRGYKNDQKRRRKKTKQAKENKEHRRTDFIFPPAYFYHVPLHRQWDHYPSPLHWSRRLEEDYIGTYGHSFQLTDMVPTSSLKFLNILWRLKRLIFFSKVKYKGRGKSRPKTSDLKLPFSIVISGWPHNMF